MVLRFQVSYTFQIVIDFCNIFLVIVILCFFQLLSVNREPCFRIISPIDCGYLLIPSLTNKQVTGHVYLICQYIYFCVCAVFVGFMQQCMFSSGLQWRKRQYVSAIEDDTMSETAEDFKWSSPNQPSHERKRLRNGGCKFPQKFKGTVPQPNGHCGAQIYANHQRVWLGTFKSETEAAMAYDSAFIKLRTRDNYRNFPWTNMFVHEHKFQSLHSTEATLNMIRDGSYPSKFEDFLRSQKKEHELGVNQIKVQGVGA